MTTRSVEDYKYRVGTPHQAADYESTTDYLLNHILETFDHGNDIATSLATLQPFDLSPFKPTLKGSQEKDEVLRELEMEQNKIDYKGYHDLYIKRQETLAINMSKAYGFLWSHCSKAMQHQIESMKSFESRIKKNPIELLKAIKQYALSYQETKYKASIIYEIQYTFFNLKQQEGESLQDYSNRFKTAREVLETHVGGPINYPKLVETMDDYDKDDVTTHQKCVKKNFEEVVAYYYMRNSDQSKYGSLLYNLQQQYSLGNDQYPKTVTSANQVLSNHRFDRPGVKNKYPNESIETPSLSFSQLEGKCYCCGKGGHKSPQCRHKSKPKEEWAINVARKKKSHDNVQAHVTSAQMNERAVAEKESQRAWMGFHSQFFQGIDMKGVILLDNQSTTDIFCNKTLLENIRTDQNMLTLCTNGGQLTTNMKGDVPGYGTVWYHPKALTNIFSFSNVSKQHAIVFDQVKDTFTVGKAPGKTAIFKNNGHGLYYFQPSYHKRNNDQLVYHHQNDEQVKQSHLQGSLDSVEENKLWFTPRQVELAKKARTLYHALGTPSLKDFKAIVTMNGVRNLPITIQDIERAELIFGPDIGALKGKTTRAKPLPVVQDYIDIPRELVDNHQEITLCMDAMKINGIPFLTTVSRNLLYRTVHPLNKQDMDNYKRAIEEVIRVYKRAGFKVQTILCDNEFRPLLHPMANEYDVNVNYANPQEHVPEAERNIRVIKERFRAAFHRLPFIKMPKIMIQILAMESAKKLNFFPPKGGVSKYFSPRMIVHKMPLDYVKHCAIPFGTYVQAHNEPSPTNSQYPRTLDCIYLRYNDSYQGGHELLNLGTEKVIKRRKVTPIPMQTNIIELVHAIATNQRMPQGLKITTLAGVDDLAGVNHEAVDYASQDDEESCYKQDENEDTVDQDEIHPDELAVRPIPKVEETTNESEDSEVEETPNEPESQEEEQAVPTSDEEENEEKIQQYVTRSGREVKVPPKYQLHQSHLQTEAHEPIEYSTNQAKVAAKYICEINATVSNSKQDDQAFAQSYSLKRGIKVFGDKGMNAAHKEIKQLHERTAFKPIHVATMTPQERKKAMESLIFLVEKKNGSVKARTCADGSVQRIYTSKQDTASPTVLTESILLTAITEAREKRDVMTVDIPNAFIQTDIETEERIVMKIRGDLVTMLVELDPETYQDFVVYDRNNKKMLYVQVLKAIYGMLQSSLLFYKKFSKDLQDYGFEINPYDPCVANRMVDGKHHTVVWHVDDLKSSHLSPKVNDEFYEWLETKYGDQQIGSVKAVRGKRHEYLAMILDYSTDGVVKIDMRAFVKAMINDFEEVKENKCPWNQSLFKVDTNSPKLDKKKAESFHTFVAKGLFLSKRARQDIQPAIAFLTTRVKEPTKNDWNKLCKVMGFLKTTQDDVLTLEAEKEMTIMWHIDASFAVHPDFKSHTGATMTLGRGCIQSISTKQKTNTRSSTEAELVASDDVVSKMMWTKRFLQAQGMTIHNNIVMRDNQGAMKLENNGKSSSGKRTRHFDIKHFYLSDLIKRGEIVTQYCPTESMLADYMTKPLTGKKFNDFRKEIMNFD